MQRVTRGCASFGKERNIGAAANFNRLCRSTGKYFKWAAHDDLIHPSYLRRLAVLDAQLE